MAVAPTKDKGRARRVIEFIENLTVPSGVGAGGRFKVRRWQRRFIQAIYEPRNPTTMARMVRRAILSVARKNGKSALIAALVLCHLVGPEAIQNGEIYSAANEREQAAVVYKVAAQMVRADPELRGLINLVDSTKTMVCMHNGSVYRALAADAGRKHGLNPSVVIYDELAQSKKRDLFDVLDTAMGARTEPLMIVISTQSADPKHILSEMIDDGLNGGDPSIVVHLYVTPEDADIWDEKSWTAANPALGDFRSLVEMRSYAARAKRMPSFESTFRNLYLNQRVDSRSPLIARAEWMACLKKQSGPLLIRGERIYLGLDLSATTDLTALVAISAEQGCRADAWHWKPGDLIKDHTDRDRVPYDRWVADEWIEAPPGRAIDYGYVAKQIGELHGQFEIVGLAFDRWRIESLLRELRANDLEAWIEGKDNPTAGALRLVPWGQGFRDMAPAIDALEVEIVERRFQHDGNPVLTMAFANAHSIQDPSGNRKLDKSAVRFRIDGAVAATMAVGLRARDLMTGPPEVQLLFV